MYKFFEIICLLLWNYVIGCRVNLMVGSLMDRDPALWYQAQDKDYPRCHRDCHHDRYNHPSSCQHQLDSHTCIRTCSFFCIFGIIDESIIVKTVISCAATRVKTSECIVSDTILYTLLFCDPLILIP